MLIVLQGELNAVNDEHKYYEKMRTRYSLAAQNRRNDEKDFEKLQEISKQQNERITKLTKEIQTLRLKIKPQNQFLLNKRMARERVATQVLSFPDYIHDACEETPRTQSNNTCASRESDVSKASEESSSSVESKTSTSPEV